MTVRGIVRSNLLETIPGLRVGVLATAVAEFGAAAATILQMVALGRIVQAVLLSHQRLAAVVPWLVMAATAAVARAVCLFLRGLVARRTARYVKTTVRDRLLQHLFRLGPAYLRWERTGELIATATEGIDRLDAYVSQYLPQRILSVGIPLLIAAVILPYDWLSALFLVLSAPVIVLLMILIGNYTQDRIQEQWEALGRVSARFLDAIQGLPTLLLFDQAAVGRKQVADSSEELRVRTLGVLRIATISGATLELMTAVAIGLVAATLAVRLLDGGITFDRAFLIFLLTPEFYRPLRELAVQRHVAMEGEVAVQRIAEIIETPAPVRALDRSPLLPAGQATIQLADVCYAYPGSDRPALDGIRLTLLPGTCMALVGRSGAGKTTLVNLLLHFIDPTAGTILVDGHPLTSFSPDAWRTRVALVPQRPYLFRGSVSDNIRLALPGASDRAVLRAAELAGVDRFVGELSHGYDTVLGERGAGLSAGQVERLALARAFLKDAPLLILDEPTSALDPESEALVRTGLQQLKRDRTVLVVAHRINTVRAADQIAVLEQGRLAEVGSHERLRHCGGAYARFTGSGVRRGVPA